MKSPLRIPEPRGKTFRLCVSALFLVLGTLLLCEMVLSHPSSITGFWINLICGAIAVWLVFLSVAEARYAFKREQLGNKDIHS